MIGIPWAEAGRTATRRLALVLAAVVVVAGVASLLAAPAATTAPSVASVYYYEEGAYHVLGAVYGPTGEPLGGVEVAFTSPQPLPPGSTTEATTDAEGVVAGSFPLPLGNYTFVLTVHTGAGSGSNIVEVSDWPKPAPNGTVVNGVGDLVPVSQGAYRAFGSLYAFFAGPNGSAPSGLTVESAYLPLASNGSGAGPSNASPATSLGALRQFDGVFSVPAPRPPPGYGDLLEIRIVNASGATQVLGIFPSSDFGAQSAPTPGANALDLVTTELGLVLAVAGLVAGLALYGTDRLLGTLDVLLARATTRAGLFLARYLGLLGLFGVAVVASLGVADLGLDRLYGAPVPAAAFAVAAAAGIAAMAAWLAVAFALAHLMRNPLRLTASVLGILVVFCFLWTPALVSVSLDATGVAGVGAGSSVGFDGAVLNPALYPSALASLALTGTGALTAVGVVLVALLWILLPLGAAWAALVREK